jgi:hypothetical protein
VPKLREGVFLTVYNVWQTKHNEAEGGQGLCQEFFQVDWEMQYEEEQPVQRVLWKIGPL